MTEIKEYYIQQLPGRLLPAIIKASGFSGYKIVAKI
jgi:hypothetical protein